MNIANMKFINFVLISVACVSCWAQFLAATERSCGGVSPCFSHSFGPCSADERLVVNDTQPRML